MFIKNVIKKLYLCKLIDWDDDDINTYLEVFNIKRDDVISIAIDEHGYIHLFYWKHQPAILDVSTH